MATYECAKCGMAVNAFCAKCEAALENDFVTSDEGKKNTSVSLSKWPWKDKVTHLLWRRYGLQGLIYR